MTTIEAEIETESVHSYGNACSEIPLRPVIQPRPKTHQETSITGARQMMSLSRKLPVIDGYVSNNKKVKVRSKMCPIPYAVSEINKREVYDMLDLEVIEISTSAFAAPIVLVKRTNSTYRFSVYFWRLNQYTIFEPEPMNLFVFHKN